MSTTLPTRSKTTRRRLFAGGLVTTAAALVAVAATPASAVYGGSGSTTQAAPFMVVLENPDGSQWCGGALIAPDKVLTAGHCVKNSPDPKGLLVIGGRTDLKSKAGQVRHVKSAKVAPKYNWSLEHDAAVITLDKPLPYKTLRVATKKDAALYANGRTATVYGWGLTATDTLGQKLKKATLTLSAPAACDPFMATDDPTLKLCGTSTKGRTDSVCSGDSGGPLVAGDVIVGIVSAGNKFCNAEFPVSVFTNVATVGPEIGLK
ncbi:S1 family peptidase [Streptomyces sp. NPDC059070]|uniref:S1 family peptidase n=1 Tax=unclassified Streptomyces TaxID=2593676 RepID=UPI0034E2FB5C